MEREPGRVRFWRPQVPALRLVLPRFILANPPVRHEVNRNAIHTERTSGQKGMHERPLLERLSAADYFFEPTRERAQPDADRPANIVQLR